MFRNSLLKMSCIAMLCASGCGHSGGVATDGGRMSAEEFDAMIASQQNAMQADQEQDAEDAK